jgi:hypothetical protein
MVGGLPFDREHRREVGKAIFEGWLPRARDVICGGRLRLEGGHDVENLVRDAATVLDVVLALGDRAPLMTLSVLIVKYGTDNICLGWQRPRDE